MKWHKSLIFKILLCCFILTFCLVGSIFGVLYRYQQSILSEMDEKSSEILRGIQVQLTNLEDARTPSEILHNRLSDLKSRHGVDAIIVYDSEKQVVSSTDSDQMPVLEFGIPERAQVVVVEPTEGRKITAYFQTFPLMVGSNPVGYVRIALAIAPQTHLVKALQSKTLITLVLLFVGTIIVLCSLIFKILRPLQTMARTCQEISEGNLHELDIRPNASEVLVLEMKFNEMVEALKVKAKMEQKLAQTQRLCAIGNLAAGIAHEIGNPLNGIKLTVSHVKDLFSARELSDESFHKYTDTIIKEVNRLDGIVRDFLMFAKERELALQPYRIDKLLHETVRLIEKDASKRGIRIETDIQAISREALIDPQLLKSALLNIIINAMDASDGSGKIRLVSTDSCDTCRIEVIDQGVGIPAEILSRIFDPYFSTKSSGTGLGLSLTKMIIEKHDGDISIESTVGKGTKVIITLPMKGM
ncbi:MAG: sensor histidine kinase [Candidatus Abyssobacteria bacterium SURF_5]|uniref:histidine kinase n=1 Tax=Abyssobacteria bacterium (strain SURF_5) TaxID=2093360 RepID=A0A3A4NAD5_ABYX5|nr:MAG: sensor histidine kinase [Candidatus Abyssubacteria bacterium SURF_5]